MLSCLIFMTLVGNAAQEKPAYARPELLAEPAELVKPGGTSKMLLLDVRKLADYQAGHISGAVHVPLDAWSKAMIAPERDAWAKRLGALGIDGKKTLVVYGPAGKVDAARIWWMLRYWGIEDVRLLDGGWEAWLAAGGKADTTAVTAVAVFVTLKPRPDRLASRDAILAGLDSGTLGQLIDSRSAGEHCGKETTAKRNGSIPGAKHMEWKDTLDARTGRVKSPAELNKLFKDAGIALDRPTTTYCQSGGRAAVMAFVVELMGGHPARNYYRSWAEWGNDPATPIALPKKP